MAIFYIVRHGQTRWNIENRIQGHSDSPLTDVGIAQATALGRELAGVKFDRVYSSDLLRARRTAELIMLEREVAQHTTEVLRERYFGTLEGKNRHELLPVYEHLISMQQHERHKHKHESGMESDEEVVSRFITFLRETAVAYPDDTILAVTHGNMIRTLLLHLGYGNPDRPRSLDIENTAYVILECDGVDYRVQHMVGVTAS